MTLESDTKFEEKLTCQFKIDMRNSTNFDPRTRKSQKFNGPLLSKVYIMFELRKYRGVMFDGTEN